MLRFPAAPAMAGALLLACVLPPALAAAQTVPAGIAAFMVMTVCTDATDTILPGVAPVDAACKTKRKIRAGETPPYSLTDFSAVTGPCADQQGIVARINVPVLQGTTQRTVSFDSHVPRSDCVLSGDGTLYGASVEGSDGVFGFIMGDAGPTGLVSYDSPPQCRALPHDTARFDRGWVIGPALLPAAGVPGYTAFRAVLTTGDPAAALQAPCPKGGPLALTAWVLDDMAFTAGVTLPALVSDHYSRADLAGTGPGTAQQMERTYWTAEFGLTRWEKWARVDWAGGTAPVPTLARAAQTAGTCSAPHDMPAAPAMQTGPLETAGSWSQVVRDTDSGSQHRWMLVQCHDYTNIDRTPPSGIPAIPAAYAGWWNG